MANPEEATESRGFKRLGAGRGWGGHENQGEAQFPATCLVDHATSLDLSSRLGVRYTSGFLPVFPRVLDVLQSPEESPGP